MKIKSGKKLLDIGFNRGYQTCFLAKEYDLFLTIGIDPWNDRKDKRPHIEYLMEMQKNLKLRIEFWALRLEFQRLYYRIIILIMFIQQQHLK